MLPENLKILSFLFNGLFANKISGGARLYNTYLSDPDKNVLQGGKKDEEKKRMLFMSITLRTVSLLSGCWPSSQVLFEAAQIL